MLYEVITQMIEGGCQGFRLRLAGIFQTVGVPLPEGSGMGQHLPRRVVFPVPYPVITSYSIHYTKLYER